MALMLWHIMKYRYSAAFAAQQAAGLHGFLQNLLHRCHENMRGVPVLSDGKTQKKGCNIVTSTLAPP
jgi:hypothetical protein